MEEQKKHGYMGHAEEKKQQEPMKQASGMPAEKPKTQEWKEAKPAPAGQQAAPKYGADKPKQEEGKKEEKSYKHV